LFVHSVIFVLEKARMHSDIRIFLFHRVSDSNENWAHPTQVSIFDKCINHISKNYTVKTIEECLSQPEKDLKGDRPLACITFDDGFKDNLKYALPILEKYKCPASFYIVTSCVDSGLPTWQHLYQNLFENTQKQSLVIDSKALGAEINKKFSGKEERIAFGKELFTRLKTLPAFEVDKILESIMQSFSDVPTPEGMIMTWADLKQLCSAGYTIGSHTHTHPFLPSMIDDTRLKHELVHSAERIKEVCGKLPQTIAYPLGITNEKVMKMAKEAGYKYGLTVEQRSYSPATDTNLMAIPRVDIYADASWLKTYLRLTGQIETIKRLVGR
jgi:peptidoglycan/xylan/chitin deacetylase (PgdA/CDA1 family)